jgi:hypothetical protein
MLLSEVLFVLFLAGFWLYCLTDAVLTPAVPGWPKRAWVAFIATTFIIGAIAWVIARRRARARYWRRAASSRLAFRDADWPPLAPAAAAAIARHPATRSVQGERPAWVVPKGPDDDPEFLSHLDRLIRGEQRGESGH